MTGQPRIDRGEWMAVVRQQSLDRRTRLVAGLLADRAARDGRVRDTVGELASCVCLTVTQVADAVATLASHELLARDGPRVLLLTRPGGDAG